MSAFHNVRFLTSAHQPRQFPPDAGAEAPALGVKRSAVLGTSSDGARSLVAIVAVAVMPGRSVRSALSTASSVV